ncbi:hypothetical protein Q3A66_12885 [Hymenobacter sp. BT770]|uniref:hypothetical protein n=1 Tax=Hymenobacter sp. BT770 TaxID=2886942 RepID=UPI001D11E116|nr:hypothetical protein [Hymenobacter sp. BT770]MCC3153817.1 hypothetical protein [Hymenobacter sp. BT770]MDO3415961.1 hypothetical protein [Hymenobacter sp. BT770]
MKKFTTVPLAALAALTFLASSCEKESNSIAPSTLAASKTEDVSPVIKNGFYKGIAPCAVGDIWLQGTPATGIYDNAGNPTSIPMRLISAQGTGVGETDTYVTDTPIQWGNSAPVLYTSSYGKQNIIDYTDNIFYPYDPATNTTSTVPQSVNQRCVTTIDMNGNITMKVTLNLKK